jgi:hypothetical protein
MRWQQFIVDLFEWIANDVETVLKGLSVDDINKQPKPDANSIGWLCWHLTRSEDRAVIDLMGQQQLWIKDKWHARFNRAPDPTETGVHHTTEQAASFVAPDAQTLIDYHRAVLEQTKQYVLSMLTEDEFDRTFDKPTYPEVATVRRRLLGIIKESFEHVGQAAYVRGQITGKGWLPA